MNIKDIKDLVKFVKSSKIKEFYYKKGDEEIRIELSGEGAHKRNLKEVVFEKSEYASQISEAEQNDLADFAIRRSEILEAELTNGKATRNDKLKEITSPFVGSFYRSSSPERSPFVEADSIVEKGNPVCIIEAMKIMNEIEVDIKCRVVSILAENGQLVEYGQPLFLVEPL